MHLHTLFVSATAAMLAIAAPAVLAAGSTHEVKFQAGHSSATVKGSVKGYDTNNYILGASRGQVMQVLFEPGHNACYFNLLGPGLDTAMHFGETAGNEYSGDLPETGKYRVEVYLMRSAARRNEVCNYAITFEISG